MQLGKWIVVLGGMLAGVGLAGCPQPAGSGACGNGIVEDGEACDDGNDVDDDACSNTCTTNTPPPDPEGCFADKDGTWTSQSAGCGVGSFDLATSGSIALNSFGDNPGTVVFTIDAADENVAEASGVIIFMVGDHICSLTCTGPAEITLECMEGDNMCTEVFTKAAKPSAP